MLKSGRRKDVQDNNNYIDKIGRITHICPKCGNLYAEDLKLSVDCNIYNCCKQVLDSYKLSTPSIEKIFTSCDSKCIQLDNRMGIIVKALFDKGYKVESCCEGHAYIKEFIPVYDFPQITILGNVKALIPSAYYNKFNIDSNFDKTIITCNSDLQCPCVCLDRFNDYKEEMLEILSSMVKSLPVCPFTYDTKESSYKCGCDVCCCG